MTQTFSLSVQLVPCVSALLFVRLLLFGTGCVFCISEAEVYLSVTVLLLPFSYVHFDYYFDFEVTLKSCWKNIIPLQKVLWHAFCCSWCCYPLLIKLFFIIVNLNKIHRCGNKSAHTSETNEHCGKWNKDIFAHLKTMCLQYWRSATLPWCL